MIIDGYAPDWEKSLEKSAVFVCIAHASYDQAGTLQANQLRYAIALQKPIFVLILPGRRLPSVLSGYADLTCVRSQGRQRNAACLRRWLEQHGVII